MSDRLNMGRPVANRHNVPQKQWKRWSNTARRVFNAMYHELRPSMQVVLMHPKAQCLPTSHWTTLRWNAAWTAADAVDGRRAASLRTKA